MGLQEEEFDEDSLEMAIMRHPMLDEVSHSDSGYSGYI